MYLSLSTCSVIIDAFHLACSKGLTDIVESLLNYSQINLLESSDKIKKQTALHIAAMDNKADLVTKFLERYGILSSHYDSMQFFV